MAYKMHSAERKRPSVVLLSTKSENNPNNHQPKKQPWESISIKVDFVMLIQLYFSPYMCTTRYFII